LSKRHLSLTLSERKELRILKFKNEDEERELWASYDSIEYADWSQAEEVTMPNLKPTLKAISIRLPEIIEELKLLAHKRDVPSQSLMKIVLAERVDQELRK